MRIQVASDLHLEFLGSDFRGERLIRPAPDADLLALVGDVANGLDGIAAFADWPVPVLYVIGNHEAYGHVLDQLRIEMRHAARGTSVVVMDNEVADLRRFEAWGSSRQSVLAGVRFLGCTLWTDYLLPSLHVTREQAMECAGLRLRDHRVIRIPFDAPFTPKEALREHNVSRRWLERELARPFGGRTVVLTHHVPHEDSVHPRYQGDTLNAAFASHLPDLVERADLWLHGHTHDSFDYTVGRCRVVSNPVGYPRNLRSVRSARELNFENEHFQWSCVVDI
jgi:predicted phosphodiesterase